MRLKEEVLAPYPARAARRPRAVAAVPVAEQVEVEVVLVAEQVEQVEVEMEAGV